MKFSIIIPVYNVEKYLKKCLNSLLNQTYQEFEIILVCDKSEDNSEKIVDEYVKQNKNFKKIFMLHTGLAKARNIGIKYVTGDYILFLDSDDFLEKKCLENLNNELQNKPDILRFQVQEVIGNKIIKHNEKGFKTTNGIKAFNTIIDYHYVENAWCYVYNVNFFSKNNFKFMDNCIAEDYGLIPLIIAKARTLKSISYVGYNYVQRENSLMSNKDYNKKIKKINDMLNQADILKKELSKISNTERFFEFINNSLIYYITTLKYKDYKKYKRILINNNCFDYLNKKGIKKKVKSFLIKKSPYLFYNYIERLL